MQQINLYQASIRKPKQLMTFAQLGWAAGVLVVVLGVVSAAQSWWQYHVSKQLTIVQQTQVRLSQSNEKINSQLNKSANDQELKRQISLKEQELENKNHLLAALSGKQFGNTQGFADQFTGLARQHVTGMWLTGLYIHAGGQKLDLQGSTYRAELVPQLLQKLALEPSFQGLEFQTFLMQRDNKKPRIDFDLRSTPKDAG